MERIGIRELRQHASRYLARVAGGESLEVTDRGHPVALLVPAPSDPWSELLASGRVIPPADDTDIVDEPPVDHGVLATAELARMRADER